MENLEVIYEDNHIIVVVKPQNIPSQSDITGDEDMLSLVKEYVKEKYNKPGEVYIGLVHRLDRPTGGLMVFARTSKAASRLSEQIKDGTFSKTYLAIVEGTPKVVEEVTETVEELMERYLEEGMDKKEAMKLVAKEKGISKSEVYKIMLDK